MLMSHETFRQLLSGPGRSSNAAALQTFTETLLDPGPDVVVTFLFLYLCAGVLFC